MVLTPSRCAALRLAAVAAWLCTASSPVTATAPSGGEAGSPILLPPGLKNFTLAEQAPFSNVSRFNVYNPQKVPFADYNARFRPAFYSYTPSVMTFKLKSSGGKNTSAAAVTQWCPPGLVFMQSNFVGVGVQFGKTGECPINYNKDWRGRSPYHEDVCTTDAVEMGFHFGEEAEPDPTKRCASEAARDIVAKNCAGRNSCQHDVYAANYSLDCPRHGGRVKAFGAYLSCGRPVVAKVAPSTLSYSSNQLIYLAGARGPDTGKYLDIGHQMIRIKVQSGPSAGIHDFAAKYVSPSVVSGVLPFLAFTNFNVTATVALWYNKANATETTAARSNEVAFGIAAPIFIRWSQPRIPAHHATTLQLFGRYFPNTGDIWARVNFDDGTQYVMKNVTQVNSNTLELEMPAHDISMIWKGVEAAVEISCGDDRGHKPDGTATQRYWQTVSSDASNPSTSVLKLVYYTETGLPVKRARILQLGVNSVNSENDSRVVVSHFSGVKNWPSTQVCRHLNESSDVAPYVPEGALLRDTDHTVSTDGQRHAHETEVHCFPQINPLLRSEGGSDSLIETFNSLGQLLWAVRGGGADDDQASAVATDHFGSVFVANRFAGPVTIGTKLMHGRDQRTAQTRSDGLQSEILLRGDRFQSRQDYVRYVGTATGRRVWSMVVTKHTGRGQLEWATEVGSCLKDTCQLDIVSTDELGYVYVVGRFRDKLSIGSMCASDKCKTANFDAFRSVDRTLQQSDRTCILEGMHQYNSSTCRHIPAAVMTGSSECKEALKSRCATDVFLAKLDQNGTVFWAHSPTSLHTYLRDTVLADKYVPQIEPWAVAALLAYRQIPEKITASRAPARTLNLLSDRLLGIFPIYPSLADAYHMEILRHRVGLTIPMLRRCVSTVNTAFEKLRAAAYESNTGFFAAISLPAMFLLSMPAEVVGDANIPQAVNVVLSNAAAYRSAVLQQATNDYQLDSFSRSRTTAIITQLNTAIGMLDPIILSASMTNDIATISTAFKMPNLYFAGVREYLKRYYAERAIAMRRALNQPMFHREIQCIFSVAGSVLKTFPTEPTMHQIRYGGATLSVELSADKFLPLTPERISVLLSNLVARALPLKGFQARIRPLLNSTTGAVTLSADRTTVTMTLPRAGTTGFNITYPEEMTISIPQTLTELGTGYPFVAQFVIRPDNTGSLWNTKHIIGDMYTMPSAVHMRNPSLNQTGHMSIAGDTFKDLTPEIRKIIMSGFVASGYHTTEKNNYRWLSVAVVQILANPSQMWLDRHNSRLNIVVQGNEQFELMASMETVTVTIPGAATVKGYDHPIGVFYIRMNIGGSLTKAASSASAASGAYNLQFKIGGDYFRPRSDENMALLVSGFQTPDDPPVANGFMEKLVPLLTDVKEYGKFMMWNGKQDIITIFLPPVAGYAPLSRETIVMVIPPEMTISGKTHYFSPLSIEPGRVPGPKWLGTKGTPAQYLDENRGNALV